MATLSDISRDMGDLSAALSALAVTPTGPFDASDQPRLASYTGLAIQAITHIAIVASGGGPKSSAPSDIDKCHADSLGIIAKLNAVITPPTGSETDQQLITLASEAINEAYAIT